MATTLKLVTGELVDITAKYPSNYWHIPTYSEMYYILYSRTNASNLVTMCRVDLPDFGYLYAILLLPDDWVSPAGISFTCVTNSWSSVTFSIADYISIINSGGFFIFSTGNRLGSTYNVYNGSVGLWLDGGYAFNIYPSAGFSNWITSYFNTRRQYGWPVRLCKNGSQFSASATTKIDFASANLQYHCTQHIWRFAEHSYDIIGADNANISDTYNGWIDLFGYGTSGVNYSPTLHTTNNADYAQSDLLGTVNDWGYNKICVDSNPLDTRTKIYENNIRALEFSNI